MNSQDYQAFIKKLRMDSRVRSLYNIELSATQHFIYNQLKIALTSKVIIEYEEERATICYESRRQSGRNSATVQDDAYQDQQW